MAADLQAASPLEYIRVYDLPAASTLPTELQNIVLYTRVKFIHAKLESAAEVPTAGSKDAGSRPGGPAGHAAGSKAKAAGFNYSKALEAALKDAGSSVSSRGDGKFNGGKDFAVSNAPDGRAKFVHLTPDALAPGNAERTLQELDKLQQLAGTKVQDQARPTPSTPATRSATGAASSSGTTVAAATRSAQQQRAAALAAAGKALTDLSDEYDSYGAGAGPTVAASYGGGSAPALRVPEYSVREVPPEEGPVGQGVGPRLLEVSVLLPEVASPAEVEVWLGGGDTLQVAVPGKYRLQLHLPFPVLDETSRVKWSKAKRRLTLTLTRQGQGQASLQ